MPRCELACVLHTHEPNQKRSKLSVTGREEARRRGRALKAQAPGAQVKRGVGGRWGNQGDLIDRGCVRMSGTQHCQCNKQNGKIGTIPMPTEFFRRSCNRSGACDSNARRKTMSHRVRIGSLRSIRLAGSARSIRTTIRTTIAPARECGHACGEQSHQQNRQDNDVAQHSLWSLGSNNNRLADNTTSLHTIPMIGPGYCKTTLILRMEHGYRVLDWLLSRDKGPR